MLSAGTPAAPMVGPTSAIDQSQTTTEHLQRTLSYPQLPDGTLRLRGGPVHARRVTWSEEVVDNEELGRKKSKVCCIYKRNREFGESSDESSSDDSSSSSDDSDNGKRNGRAPDRKKGCDKDHDHDHSHNNNNENRRAGAGRRGRPQRPPSPNAYEKIPRNQTKKKQGGSAPGGETTTDKS